MQDTIIILLDCKTLPLEVWVVVVMGEVDLQQVEETDRRILEVVVLATVLAIIQVDPVVPVSSSSHILRNI